MDSTTALKTVAESNSFSPSMTSAGAVCNVLSLTMGLVGGEAMSSTGAQGVNEPGGREPAAVRGGFASAGRGIG